MDAASSNQTGATWMVTAKLAHASSTAELKHIFFILIRFCFACCANFSVKVQINYEKQSIPQENFKYRVAGSQTRQAPSQGCSIHSLLQARMTEGYLALSPKSHYPSTIHPYFFRFADSTPVLTQATKRSKSRDRFGNSFSSSSASDRRAVILAPSPPSILA